VRLSAGPETLRIEIEDNGVGLPGRDRDRLTEPYVTTREKGTGLGLAIVKRILEEHNGGLELADRAGVGGGARIALDFPLGRPDTGKPPARARAAKVRA
jgi:two-component system nitrogen regulation sensor histidine kinase NtrY